MSAGAPGPVPRRRRRGRLSDTPRERSVCARNRPAVVAAIDYFGVPRIDVDVVGRSRRAPDGVRARFVALARHRDAAVVLLAIRRSNTAQRLSSRCERARAVGLVVRVDHLLPRPLSSHFGAAVVAVVRIWFVGGILNPEVVVVAVGRLAQPSRSLRRRGRPFPSAPRVDRVDGNGLLATRRRCARSRRRAAGVRDVFTPRGQRE